MALTKQYAYVIIKIDATSAEVIACDSVNRLMYVDNGSTAAGNEDGV